MTILAAGILYIAKDGTALFLKRGNGGDHPGEWNMPGGRIEDGETAEQAARREFEEETGAPFKGTLKLWARQRSRDARPMLDASAPVLPTGDPDATPQETARCETSGIPVDDVDYTTFIARGGETFIPTLNDEHTAFAWALPSLPPEPMHPGCAAALSKLTMDELGIAKAMAAGQLTSPQYYENLALFDIRITGTGTAYRKALDEYCYRPPEVYLTQEFLERCNGLPVIWEHPEKRAMLNTQEYAARNIGSIFVPYIKGQEVWGIAKILDHSAAQMMEEEQLSTSPSVVFRDRTVNTTVSMEGGDTLLIEGNPSLLDHIAICTAGIWDKGGDPVGIIRGDSAMPEMTEEEKARADKARLDADAGTKLDKLLSHMDSIGGRLDSIEGRIKACEDSDKSRKDSEESEKAAKKAEEEKADKARKDAEEKEEKAKADAAKKDSEGEDGKPKEVVADNGKKDEDTMMDSRSDAQVRAIVADAIKSVLPRQLTDEEVDAMSEVQARADAVMAKFGDRAPRPLDGDTPLAYQRRMVEKLKKHSVKWKDVPLAGMTDSALAVIAADVYHDAEQAALNPEPGASGTLRMLQRNSGGHIINDWVGQPGDWMNPLAGSVRLHAVGTFGGKA